MNDDFWMKDASVPHYTAEYTYEQLCEFENKVMNHISLSRIFTYQGFKNHFMKMPFTILKYTLQNPKVALSILKREILNSTKER